MNAYKNKFFIPLSLSLLFLAIYFSTKHLTKEPITSETTEQQAADNKAILKSFSGEWKTLDDTKSLKFSNQNQVITMEFSADNRKVNVNVSSQQPARNRWPLSPTDGEEIQYSVILVSDDELIFNLFTTKSNTDGTSKPENFYRAK